MTLRILGRIKQMAFLDTLLPTFENGILRVGKIWGIRLHRDPKRISQITDYLGILLTLTDPILFVGEKEVCLASPPSRSLHFLVFDTEVGLPLNLQGFVMVCGSVDGLSQETCWRPDPRNSSACHHHSAASVWRGFQQVNFLDSDASLENMQRKSKKYESIPNWIPKQGDRQSTRERWVAKIVGETCKVNPWGIQHYKIDQHMWYVILYFSVDIFCLLWSFRPFALVYSCTVVEGSSSCWSRGFIPAQITCSLKNWSWEHMLPGYRNTRESNMVGRVETALKGKGAPHGEIWRDFFGDLWDPQRHRFV